MASKNDDGFDKLTNRDQNLMAFCNEFRTYVEEHHHFLNKHTSMLNAIKYTRKIHSASSGTNLPTPSPELLLDF